jgi:hypothetical protein
MVLAGLGGLTSLGTGLLMVHRGETLGHLGTSAITLLSMLAIQVGGFAYACTAKKRGQVYSRSVVVRGTTDRSRD